MAACSFRTAIFCGRRLSKRLINMKSSSAPWQNNKFDLDLSAGTRLITNTWRKTRIEPSSFWWNRFVGPRSITTKLIVLTFRLRFRGVQHERARRMALRCGLIQSWSMALAFQTIRRAPELIYGNGFFPFSQPVEVMEGDRIKLRLAAKLVVR